ncbi:MAG: cupin domain-containing protein [Phycisphaeraceae bacterium]|nr:cupin domain-containing protein [Phycisphaeraceae bacterium]MCB9848352.1 cupin domain-containing protein [Phycisphaeraceae bacterium]
MPGAEQVSMAMMIGRDDGAPNFAMRQFHVAPGGHSPRHSHDYEHEVLILGGAGTVHLEGADHPIRQGDVIYVPADQEHQFVASADPGDGGLRFICLVPVERNCGGDTPGS